MIALPETRKVPIFPLQTVLFPGGRLPLKVFEQRYVEMMGACLKDEQPFGVCLLKEGSEVGAPAVPETVGTLARIDEWDMQQLGVFQLTTGGLGRFRILQTRVLPNRLVTADVQLLPDESATELGPKGEVCARVLRHIVEKVGAEHFPRPLRFDNPVWVGYRLAEILPLPLSAKQRMLEITDTAARLEILLAYLKQEGLTDG